MALQPALWGLGVTAAQDEDKDTCTMLVGHLLDDRSDWVQKGTLDIHLERTHASTF